MRRSACLSLCFLFIAGCPKDATCPAGMMVDERLGYCVTPDAGADASTPDSGPMMDAAADGGACVPETCNGADEDCDGTPDDGFTCVRGTTIPCTTTCGSTGTTTCSATCEPSTTCTPPIETCNYTDDDCDGLTDEDLLDPGPGIDLAGPSSQVDVVAVPGGFVIANVLADGPPSHFDLVRIAEDDTVTHTVTAVGEVGFSRVALATRPGEVAAAWNVGDATIVGQRFAEANLAALAPSVTMNPGSTGFVSDLAASSANFALASFNTRGSLWKLHLDLTWTGAPVPASFEGTSTIAIPPAAGSEWIMANSEIPPASTVGQVFVRHVDPSTLALASPVQVTTMAGGAGGAVLALAPDGSRLAVLYGAGRGSGVSEPELAILDPETLAVGPVVSMPRPQTRSFLGPSAGLAWSGGQWWVARIVQDGTPMFVARLRVVQIGADGTALGAGTSGISPDCDPPDADCAPPSQRGAAAIAAQNGRVLVAAAGGNVGPGRAWIYRCR